MTKIAHTSVDGLGVKIWWFGRYERIRRVPAAYASSGRTEYWVDFLPTDQIFRSRYVRCFTWNMARKIMADPVNTQ